jgi:hypothetical protein
MLIYAVLAMEKVIQCTRDLISVVQDVKYHGLISVLVPVYMLTLNTNISCIFSEMLEHVERKLFSNGKPINSTVALINEDFRLAGEIIVMSILQGGPAPSFINPDVFRYLTKQTLTIERMPESKYKETAEKVCCSLLEILEQLTVLYSSQ